LLALKRKGPDAKECEHPLEAEKGKELSSLGKEYIKSCHFLLLITYI
jgi:hypothetical protein